MQAQIKRQCKHKIIMHVFQACYRNVLAKSNNCGVLFLPPVKIDKLAEEERRRKQEEERIFREDEMRELALKLREKERRKRQYSDEEDNVHDNETATAVLENEMGASNYIDGGGGVVNGEDKNGGGGHGRKDKQQRRR